MRWKPSGAGWAAGVFDMCGNFTPNEVLGLPTHRGWTLCLNFKLVCLTLGSGRTGGCRSGAGWDYFKSWLYYPRPSDLGQSVPLLQASVFPSVKRV